MNQTFKISGMTCEHCVNAVRKAILKIDNTAEINIDLNEGLTSVKSSQPHSVIVAAIEEEGYQVTSP